MNKILTIDEYQQQTKAKLIKGKNQSVLDDKNIFIEEIEDFFYIADINNVNHIVCDYIYYDEEEYENVDTTRPFALFLSFILNNFVYVSLVEDDWLEVDEQEEGYGISRKSNNKPMTEKDIIEKEWELLLKELSLDENFMVNGTNKQYRAKIARDMIEENKDKYPLLSDVSKIKEYIEFQYDIDNLYHEERMHYRIRW